MTIHYLKPEYETEDSPPRNPIPGIDPPEGFIGTWTPLAPYFIMIRCDETENEEDKRI